MRRWTKAERHFIHIARSEYGLDWTQIATIFPFAFPRGFSIYATPTADELEVEYPSRNSTSVVEMWGRHIWRATYTAEQENDRADVRQAIQTAAQRVGIVLRQSAVGAAGYGGGLGGGAGQAASSAANPFAPGNGSTTSSGSPPNPLSGLTSPAAACSTLPQPPVPTYHSSNLPRYTQQTPASPSYSNPLQGSPQNFGMGMTYPNPLHGRQGPGLATRYHNNVQAPTQATQHAPMLAQHNHPAPQTQPG